MLKIKDNFDLEKLKDYGFVNDEIYGRKVKIKRMMTEERYNSEIIEIDLLTRQLQIFIDDEYYEIYTKSDTLDFIYVLIKDGIVEKVSDKDE